MGKQPLNIELNDEPYRFDFFQAVRLLEKIYPDREPVGDKALPDKEIARFRSRIAMDFPASEIQEIFDTEDERTGAAQTEVHVNFMGMAGVSGVLPVHYTELVLDRVRHRDSTLWSFLDIFTHRAVSMFYRAWAKYRFPVGYERGNDPFTGFLYDFAGLGTDGLRGRSEIDDESLLPYVGLIVQRPHSANALENIVSDYFGIQVELKQFFGQWLQLTKSDLTRIGVKNSVLGRSAIVGQKVWDQQSKFRLLIGPLTFNQFLHFLPNGSGYRALNYIVRFFVGLEFDFDFRLRLLGRHVPGCVLTTRAARRPMLGWTTFLKTLPVKGVDEQLVLSSSN
ncbi:MAG: type VI secretion system baseplate subunit TssG [Pyrinomonadaceae bacterium]